MAAGVIDGFSHMEFRGAEVCTAAGGATLDTSGSYTRAAKRNGIANVEIRIQCPTISAETAIAILTPELIPVMDVTYIKTYDMWGTALNGTVSLRSNGAVAAQSNCSGKNIQIVATYVTLTL